MDLSEIATTCLPEVDKSLCRGMSAWGVPEPMSLEEWAQKHFYLSAESSYVEQPWVPWPFQCGIMSCISNDDIEEVDLLKSARVGCTKIMLAAIGYFGHHKKRNQAIWQPTDEDRDEFVKTELDTMFRDVRAMREVFPSYLARHKDNTLQQKKLIGSVIHLKGGKAAKNYRRISIDVGYIDEADAFDSDVEKEGDPFTLASKRTEGATFPKMVVGSTPKLKGFSLIEARYESAEQRFTYQIPCLHCGEYYALTWGGKDEPHGMKFTGRDPASVRHLCPHCSALISQSDYLQVWEQGVWINEDGTIHLHADGHFTDSDGNSVDTPKHVGLFIWSAYSPSVDWVKIVKDYLEAYEKMQAGDSDKMKAFFNTTLGQTWEDEIERTDAEELKQRAENFKLKKVPDGCLLLLCGGDTQGNRMEFGVWGYGSDRQMWTIEHKIIFGNPSQPEIWKEVEDFLFSTIYLDSNGNEHRIYATAIDSGGHSTNDVYAFAHKHRSRRVYAVKGASGRERSIEHSVSRVSYRESGRAEKTGALLWFVGTNLAKDRFHQRLDIPMPGPGYVHFSQSLTDEWFRQMAGEDRAIKRTQNGTETRWIANRQRIEARDCLTYTIWLEERLKLWSPRSAEFWLNLEENNKASMQKQSASPNDQEDDEDDDLFTPIPLG